MSKQESFTTGSVRDSREGKGRFDLLPLHALWALAGHFEYGATRYGDHNWRKGQPASRYVDSMMRHFTEFILGITDSDHTSPYKHLVAGVWNAVCLFETAVMVKLGVLPLGLLDLPWMTKEGSDVSVLEATASAHKGVLEGSYSETDDDPEEEILWDYGVDAHVLSTAFKRREIKDAKPENRNSFSATRSDVEKWAKENGYVRKYDIMNKPLSGEFFETFREALKESQC